ncbi:InlB B-repeat-containing protein [Fibrobacter succinogenes]|uniref:InlB B-repeat-containing protein n=1 Tax=Fibrobacter succinogenes TaxID=833 RepID=UPI0015691872|nr:InlB B-repeat-containing protein [Fibrobacter succinogenes]
MENLKRLLVLAAMFLPMSAWAAPFDSGSEKKHINLYYKSEALYIAQEDKACTVGSSTVDDGTCVKTAEIKSMLPVRGAFNNVVSGKWVLGTANTDQYQSNELNLKTDIDFGQTLDADGKCSENHNFLSFGGLTFNGRNHTISNLCRVDNGAMDQYVGLFGEINGKTVKNLKISNVHFVNTSEDPKKTEKGEYLASGALAYKISNNSTVTNVELENVDIQAPLAGGLAGYIEGSTIKGVKTGSPFIKATQAAGALAYKISNGTVTDVELENVDVQAPLAGGLAGYIEGSTISSIKMVDEGSVIKVTNVRQIETGYVGSSVNGSDIRVFSPYKVLLGGLAGAAFFTNFKNIDIAVQVENKAVVDLSALGGLVGNYVYAPLNNQFSQVSDRNSAITNVNIHGYANGDDYIKPVVSGGIIMGGILGATKRLDENNSPIVELAVSKSSVTNLDITQSKIKINDADVSQQLYFGGIVGNANLCSGGILLVKESNVKNVNIEESIQGNAPFQYYMGGIAGYASCYHISNSVDQDDLYLTLQKDTASGNIKLSGGYSKTGKTVSKVRASAAIGGLVGNAILSLKENGISENESKVSIAYDAKRTANENLDSVLVGGIFGVASISEGSTVRLSKLSYQGSIDIDDDGISARVGGIVGKFPLLQSGIPKIDFHDVHVEGASGKAVVAYSGESTASSINSSSVGGICGACQSPREISKSSVNGDFVGTSGNQAPPKKAFHIGGLIGSAFVNEPLIVKNNYFMGSIENKFNKSGGEGKVGYLFGYLTGDGLGVKPQVTSNFHYGDDNVGAIGYFENYGEFANSVYLDELEKFEAKSNVRNGNKVDLNDDGNGYVTEAYMKSKNLAILLNSPWSDEEDQVWTFGTTNDFPFWGTPAMSTYTVRFLDADGNQIGESQEVHFGAAAVAPEAPKIVGKCFDGWSTSFNKVMASMDVVATYKNGACKYPVAFYDLEGNLLEVKAEDGTTLSNPQEVEEGKSAIVPTNNPKPTADGKCFDGWKQDFSNITGELNVYPEFKTCEYTVKFTYFKVDGSGEKITQTVKYNESATPPSSDDFPQKTNNGRCFTEWDPTVDFTHVKDNLTVTAQYEICKYTVKFMYTDNHGVSQILKTETVEHGSSAAAPKDDEFPQKIDDQCFAGWKPDFSHVTNPLNVTAQYKTCESSSSSSQQPSGSSSSSATSSSSSDQKSSSSGTPTPNSSSSVSYIATITKPSATQQDNALRMTFNDLQADKHTKVDYHIVVESKTGTYLDTVVSGKDIESIKNGTWRLSPAPAGEYTVIVVLTDGRDSVRYDDFLFEGEDEFHVDLLPNTWQTYSLSAFCQDKGDDCKNKLKEHFARKAEFEDSEECRHKREELAQTPDDEDFREYVEENCPEAMESQDDATTTAFWWDESSPVGDYWQYRKFNVDQDFDSTRGYWYGPIVREPLKLSLQTPNMKDEIVWKLENKYSGWNLVANPYGWYVKLPQEEGVTFAKWYPDVSGYDTISVLGPYEAVWVKTEKSRELRIPLKAAIVFEDEWKSPPLLKSATSESWNFRVELTDKNGKRDAWNELAAGDVASSLSEPPAGMGDHVNLSIVEGKQRLAKSVKKNGEDFEWNLEVSATTTRDGKLNFVGLEKVWAKGLHVYATIDDETVEVVKDSPVNVKLSSKAKSVSVRVTKSAVAAQVAKNQISGFRVNQMQNALNVGFDAVSKLAGAKVKVSVVGVDGRVVATSGLVAHEGTNSISMKKPKQGLYFVRLKVGSQSAVSRIMVR